MKVTITTTPRHYAQPAWRDTACDISSGLEEAFNTVKQQQS
jgi:hypothetical protein